MPLPTLLPVSRIAPANEAPPLRWGLLGSGWIAERFIESVRAHTKQDIVAIGSRNKDRAEQVSANDQALRPDKGRNYAERGGANPAVTFTWHFGRFTWHFGRFIMRHEPFPCGSPIPEKQAHTRRLYQTQAPAP